MRILQELRKYVERGSAGKQELVEASEKWLDEQQNKHWVKSEWRLNLGRTKSGKMVRR